jgi:hypothetical protein
MSVAGCLRRAGNTVGRRRPLFLPLDLRYLMMAWANDAGARQRPCETVEVLLMKRADGQAIHQSLGYAALAYHCPGQGRTVVG